SNSAAILIQSAHTVTVSANLTADNAPDDLTVDGELYVALGVTFVLNDGLAATDMTVNGTFRNFSLTAHTYPAGSMVNYTAGSFYEHSANGGTMIPVANSTFDAASTV